MMETPPWVSTLARVQYSESGVLQAIGEPRFEDDGPAYLPFVLIESTFVFTLFPRNATAVETIQWHGQNQAK